MSVPIRPLVCASFALGLVLALTGCRTPGARTGVLRVGTSDDYAPFSSDGRGFDVDVARALAHDLGLRIEWVRFRWPELTADVRAGRFDVGMSGITWRPGRAVLGRMTRAVASGGPCVIGDVAPSRVGVNRGGVLERYARAQFAGAEIVTLDQNRALPDLLARGRVDAIVTDSFELPHFLREGQPAHCAPPRDRKVYWVTPSAPPGLAERIDAWLAGAEPELQRLRAHWLGERAPRTRVDHLVDLLARRLELMPSVVRWKRLHGMPIEDLPREAEVLHETLARAASVGLDPSSTRALFELQIELAKRVQARTTEASAGRIPDLRAELRPALSRIGAELLELLADLVPLESVALTPERLSPLGSQLSEPEVRELVAALLAVRRASPS